MNTTKHELDVIETAMQKITATARRLQARGLLRQAECELLTKHLDGVWAVVEPCRNRQATR